MTFFDAISFAKLFSQTVRGNMTMSDTEMEAAAKALKEFGDNVPSWTLQQRELYKALVDAVKENSKIKQNGQLNRNSRSG